MVCITVLKDVLLQVMIVLITIRATYFRIHLKLVGTTDKIVVITCWHNDDFLIVFKAIQNMEIVINITGYPMPT